MLHKSRSVTVCFFEFFSYAQELRNLDIDAPARLKKDLEKVIAIQADLDRVDETIRSASSILGQGTDVSDRMKQLTESHAYLSSKVDDLYSSLNILESFPTLKHLPFAAVHKLLLARDLKINVRKRAIGSFFEYDKLEQAAGGRAQALGVYPACQSNFSP